MTNISSRLSFYLSALLLLFAPLYFAGKTPEGLFINECIGLAILFFVVWGGIYSGKLSTWIWLYLFLSMMLALVYFLPISFDVWQSLPGRALYTESHAWLRGQGDDRDLFQLSIVPSETVLSLLVLLPILGIFFSAASLPDQQVKSLVYVLLTVATLQALLGILQYVSGSPNFLFGIKSHGQNAQGMYTNRDHYVALLEMTLPLLLGLVLYSIGRKRLQREASFSVNKVLLLSFATIVVLVGAVFSRSRAGIFLIFLVVFLSSIIFSRHIGGRQSASFTATLLVTAGGITASLGLLPVLSRFLTLDPFEDGRWAIFETTITAIKAFFPIGSGPGTYDEVYRMFQPVEQAFFLDHAHNDYLELLLEMGGGGVFIIVGFFLVYSYGWLCLRKRNWNQMMFLQVGSGLSILALLLHSLVDFNLHTPANFIVFAFLVGVFLRKA